MRLNLHRMVDTLRFTFPARSGRPMDKVEFGLEDNLVTFYFRRTGTDTTAYWKDRKGLDIDDLYLMVLDNVCYSRGVVARQALMDLSQHASNLMSLGLIQVGPCRLTITQCETTGDRRYCMTGPSGVHTLDFDSPNAKRLEAHWHGFLHNNGYPHLHNQWRASGL